MKPNFMVIGAAKCASSTIKNILKQHPDIFMIQKPNFFSDDEVYGRGLDWYESLYEKAANKKMRGDGCNHYTMKELFPKTVSRIVSFTTDLKLIYIVRDPISRIESYWLQKRSHGGEQVHYDFNKAVRVNREWLVDSSNYWQQINVYREHFSDQQIHIIFYEDFKVNPNQVMRRCFEFLNVDSTAPQSNANLHLNPSSGKRIPTNTLSRLRALSLFKVTAKLIPDSLLKPIMKQFLFKEVKERPQWNSHSREWVTDILEADTRQFLEYCGKPADFWNLRDSSPNVM